MEKKANRFTEATYCIIELNHPSDYFRIDIKIVDYKHGESPDWDIIRESARVLERYKDKDNVASCVIWYNGVFAGEVLFQFGKYLWFSVKNKYGKEIYNV